MSDKDLQAWILREMRGGGLPALLHKIDEQRVSFAIQAMQPGDTDFHKGQATALQWARDLPETLLEDSGTGADT